MICLTAETVIVEMAPAEDVAVREVADVIVLVQPDGDELQWARPLKLLTSSSYTRPFAAERVGRRSGRCYNLPGRRTVPL